MAEHEVPMSTAKAVRPAARCTGMIQPYTATVFDPLDRREGDRASEYCIGAYNRTMPARQCRNAGKYPCDKHGARCRLHRCDCPRAVA
jgi:hypothetical protein